MQTTRDDDAHQTLLEKIQARREELELTLAEGGPDQAAIEAALGSIGPLLTGDLENLPDMVSRDLVRWLETNRYVGVRTAKPTVAPDEAPDTRVSEGVERYDADKAMAEPTGAAPIVPQV